MKPVILDQLNKQLNMEFYSAYFYLSMVAYLQSKNLPGAANWMNIQYQEEQAHAMKLFQYIINRGGKVKLEIIESPPAEWKDIIDVFEHVLEHEKKITESINNIFDSAHSEKDHATFSLLQWYVNEQVEEESNVETILSRLKMVEGKGTGLFMLDNEMNTRVFQPIQ